MFQAVGRCLTLYQDSNASKCMMLQVMKGGTCFMYLLPKVENSPGTISETPKEGTKKEKHGQRKNNQQVW